LLKKCSFTDRNLNIATLKLGYNDHGYNEFMAITNKYNSTFLVPYPRVRYNQVWLYINFFGIVNISSSYSHAGYKIDANKPIILLTICFPFSQKKVHYTPPFSLHIPPHTHTLHAQNIQSVSFRLVSEMIIFKSIFDHF